MIVSPVRQPVSVPFIPFPVQKTSDFKIQFYRTMVGAQNICVYFSVLKPAFQLGRGNKIINSPSCVLFHCLKPVRPPGINVLLIRIKISERINKAALQDSGKTFSFFIGKSRIFAVAFWIFQVNVLMRHVQITAADYRFLLL